MRQVFIPRSAPNVGRWFWSLTTYDAAYPQPHSLTSNVGRQFWSLTTCNAAYPKSPWLILTTFNAQLLDWLRCCLWIDTTNNMHSGWLDSTTSRWLQTSLSEKNDVRTSNRCAVILYITESSSQFYYCECFSRESVQYLSYKEKQKGG